MSEASRHHVDAVRDAAVRFRAALEQGGLRLPGLQAFPRGACGDTCELLAEYLREQRLGEWLYVMGLSDDGLGFSHAWLRQDVLLLDITGDQFAGHPTYGDAHWPAVRLGPEPIPRFNPNGSGQLAGLGYWNSRRQLQQQASDDFSVLRERAESLRTGA